MARYDVHRRALKSIGDAKSLLEVRRRGILWRIIRRRAVDDFSAVEAACSVVERALESINSPLNEL